MIYLRSTLFYLGEALSTIPFVIVAGLAYPLPAKTRSRLISGWAIFVIWWLKICCNLRYEVVGTENIPEEPCVFACNHQSTWEAISTQIFLPPIAWVLKKELFRIPFFGWGLWATKPIAINRLDRQSALEQVVSQGKDKIAGGRHVLIFPEGTRTHHRKLGFFKKGAAMLARSAQVDVVPIAHNAGRFWSPESLLIKPGVVHCVIGPKIEIGELTDGEVTQKVKAWIADQNL